MCTLWKIVDNNNSNYFRYVKFNDAPPTLNRKRFHKLTHLDILSYKWKQVETKLPSIAAGNYVLSVPWCLGHNYVVVFYFTFHENSDNHDDS